MTATLAPDIAAFAAAVRGHLSDLAPDEVDDLTDGLEADLAERLSDTPAEELGDAAAYAAELRAAAGHPPRAAGEHVGSGAVQSALDEFRAEAAEWRARWERFLERRPELTAIMAFLVALRPLWWVIRGMIVGTLLVSTFESGWSLPKSAFGWFVVLVVVVVSVQFGRGRWLPNGGLRTGLAVVNVFLAVSAPFIAANALFGWNSLLAQAESADYASYDPLEGLYLDGVPVGNIFAYDAEGEPLEQVQLFDQDGKPLDLFGPNQEPFLTGWNGTMLAGSPDVAGRVGWNVYPLGTADFGEHGDPDDARIDPATPPFAQVKPLWGVDAAGDDAPAGGSLVADGKAAPWRP